jgi:hypothetical protein
MYFFERFLNENIYKPLQKLKYKMNSQLITIISTLMMNTSSYEAKTPQISQLMPWQFATNIPYEDKEKTLELNNRYAIKDEELKIKFERPKKAKPLFSFKDNYLTALKESYLTRTQHK